MSENNLIIRNLAPEDEAAWRELWRQYLEYYKTELPANVYDQTFSRLLDQNQQDCHALVAEYNNQVVGLVHCIFHLHCWKTNKVCYLQDLFTDPQHRNSGIARALINSVYEFADKNNYESVYWMTQDFNKTARHLYDKIATLTPFIKYARPE